MWSAFLWLRKKGGKKKKSHPGSSRPCTEDGRRKTTCPYLSLQRWCSADAVSHGPRQDQTTPAEPGPVFCPFFVTVPRGKTTKAVFIDVRGAAKEDVFIGLSVSASLFFMLFVRCPSVFTSHRLCNTTRVLSNEARSRHPAAGDMDYLLVLNRLE